MDSVPGPSGLCLHASVSVTVSLAGNGRSSNGSSDTPKRPKKRPRQPESWKRNVAKAKRAKGEEYTSPSTGKTIPARSTGPPCTCKKRCFELISDDEKRQLLEAFNGLTSKDLQDAHLFGLIVSNKIKRRRPRGASARSARRASYTYHVRLNVVCGYTHLVCYTCSVIVHEPCASYVWHSSEALG
jgi:hypothetical protein